MGCARNEANYADHIWDRRDGAGRMGATACVVVPAFWDVFQGEGDWQKLAWWVHDHLPYSALYFFPKMWAFNIQWREEPERRIDYIFSGYPLQNGLGHLEACRVVCDDAADGVWPTDHFGVYAEFCDQPSSESD